MEKKILIVDDSESIRAILKNTLEKQGFTTTTAKDGVDALNKGLQDDFDLIITDLHMPNMDGTQFIQNIRAHEKYKFTPILILTTETQQEEKDRAKAAGATGWIIKPFIPDKILASIRRVIH